MYLFIKLPPKAGNNQELFVTTRVTNACRPALDTAIWPTLPINSSRRSTQLKSPSNTPTLITGVNRFPNWTTWIPVCQPPVKTHTMRPRRPLSRHRQRTQWVAASCHRLPPPRIWPPSPNIGTNEVWPQQRELFQSNQSLAIDNLSVANEGAGVYARCPVPALSQLCVSFMSVARHYCIYLKAQTRTTNIWRAVGRRCFFCLAIIAIMWN